MRRTFYALSCVVGCLMAVSPASASHDVGNGTQSLAKLALCIRDHAEQERYRVLLLNGLKGLDETSRKKVRSFEQTTPDPESLMLAYRQLGSISGPPEPELENKARAAALAKWAEMPLGAQALFDAYSIRTSQKSSDWPDCKLDLDKAKGEISKAQPEYSKPVELKAADMQRLAAVDELLDAEEVGGLIVAISDGGYSEEEKQLLKNLAIAGAVNLVSGPEKRQLRLTDEMSWLVASIFVTRLERDDFWLVTPKLTRAYVHASQSSGQFGGVMRRSVLNRLYEAWLQSSLMNGYKPIVEAIAEIYRMAKQLGDKAEQDAVLGYGYEAMKEIDAKTRDSIPDFIYSHLKPE